MVDEAVHTWTTGRRAGGARRLGPALTRAAGHPPALMYHGIEEVPEDPFGLFVSPRRFEQQMAALATAGLRGVSLGELGDAVASGRAAGLVGLTFDDGYLDLMTSVPSVLAQHDFTATVFVVAGLLGGENVWDPPPRHRLVDRADVRRLRAQGLEIGSHSQRHVRLAGLDAQSLSEEVAGSRAILSALLGEEVRTFCYPYGSADAAAAEAVREAGYTYACAVARVPGLPDQFATPRVMVSDRDWSLRLLAKLVLRGR